MTNQTAIEIVNNLMILNKDEFYPDELEAFKKLIQTAKDYDYDVLTGHYRIGGE